MKRLISLSLFLLAVPVLAAPKPPKLGQLILSVSPRMGMSGGSGCVVRVSVSIPLPTPEFFCPSIELTVYGKPLCDAQQAASSLFGCEETSENVPTYHEKQEGDCPPWRDQEEVTVDGNGEGSYIPSSWAVPFSWPYDGAKRFRLGPGDWTVEVLAVQGKRRVFGREHVLVN